VAAGERRSEPHVRDGDRHPEAGPVTGDPAPSRQPAAEPPAAVDLVQPVPAFPPRFPDHPAPGEAGNGGILPGDSAGGALADPFAAHRLGSDPHVGATGAPVAGVGAPTGRPGAPELPPRPGGSRLRSPVWLVATVVLVAAMGLALWSTRAWVVSQGSVTTGASSVLPLPEVPHDDGGLIGAPSDPPEDAEWSRDQIRAAMGIAFDAQADPTAWSAAVDAPGVTMEQLTALSARCGPVVAVVDAIDFTSRDDAFLRFRLVGSRVPGVDAVVFTGGAVRRDGVWKVTGFTLDAVAGAAGSTCT
jgi:hypothetical protein